MRTKNLFLLIVSLAVVSPLAFATGNKSATLLEDHIWANGEIYSTVITATSFKMPPGHSVDILFNFDMSGLSGQRPISDAAPGDSYYNGGRWAVYIVTFTEAGKLVHDPDGDDIANFELTSAEQVEAHIQLGHITVMPANFYFSCPLIKTSE